MCAVAIKRLLGEEYAQCGFYQRWRVNADIACFDPYFSDLPEDPYLKSGARHRRYRVANIMQSRLGLRPSEPHFQSQKYNRLFGGIDRYLASIHDAFFDEPAFRSIFKDVASRLPEASTVWRMQIHQFRINAPGEPTPEGIHRDGADFVFMLLVKRMNIEGGETSLFAQGEEKAPCARMTLENPGDCLLLDDRAFKHYVSPIQARKPEASNAYRDMLVMTFHKPDRN